MQTVPTQGGGVYTTRSVSQSERALLAQWLGNACSTGGQAAAATGSDLARFRTLPERSLPETLPLPTPDRSAERLFTTLSER